MDLIHKKLRDAQLIALQNQIKPHYIVNTLDAIRMKLILDGQSESAELLRCFQESLRTYALQPDEKVTLEEELIFLEDFLKLQCFRYLGKLTWNFYIESTALRWHIPRFILQPLVENAVRHGLDPGMEAPTIKVEARLAGDRLFLSVLDNGRGTSGNPGSGIGIQNVNERLRLLYGEDCTVSVKSVPDTGTCASLYLPANGGENL